MSIATSPTDPRTHWQQAFFPFRQSASVVQGDHLEVTFRIGPKADHSDNTSLSYDYRCTQLANESTQSSKQAGLSGRNAPCPCGSGKKFKRCCGNS